MFKPILPPSAFPSGQRLHQFTITPNQVIYEGSSTIKKIETETQQIFRAILRPAHEPRTPIVFDEVKEKPKKISASSAHKAAKILHQSSILKENKPTTANKVQNSSRGILKSSKKPNAEKAKNKPKNVQFSFRNK